MKQGAFRIMSLRSVHIPDCRAIVSASDPWKRLNEEVDFPAALRDRSTRSLVCLSGAEVAGFILFLPGPVFARGGYLRAIAVAPSFRGRGVGSLLLAHAETITAKHASHFFLCVSSFNRRGQAFYKSCGFRKVGSLPGLITPHASELIYWKPFKTTKPRRPKS